MEIWFGILPRKALRNRSISCVDEIDEVFHSLTVYRNDREAQPFECKVLIQDTPALG